MDKLHVSCVIAWLYSEWWAGGRGEGYFVCEPSPEALLLVTSLFIFRLAVVCLLLWCACKPPVLDDSRGNEKSSVVFRTAHSVAAVDYMQCVCVSLSRECMRTCADVRCSELCMLCEDVCNL